MKKFRVGRSNPRMKKCGDCGFNIRGSVFQKVLPTGDIEEHNTHEFGMHHKGKVMQRTHKGLQIPAKPEKAIKGSTRGCTSGKERDPHKDCKPKNCILGKAHK